MNARLSVTSGLEIVLLRVAEAQKQDSIIGALATAIRHLEEAIRTSLEGMGEKFKESCPVVRRTSSVE